MVATADGGFHPLRRRNGGAGICLSGPGPGEFSGFAPVVGLLLDAIIVAFWPLVLALRVLLRRRWLIEAYSVGDNWEGAAWKVRGLGASRAAVDAIAGGIEAGNREPAPPGAVPTHFRLKLDQPKPGPNLYRRLLRREN